ncbi:MAG: response regulator [Deltaproteobacteria bacterium]|nr:response regulator [Deltaproteobacteria bacterium]
MTFRSARTYGLGLILTILLLVGLAPTYMVFEVSGHSQKLSTEVASQKLTFEAQAVFLKTRHQFDTLNDFNEKQFSLVLGNLEKAIRKADELVGETRDEKKKKLLESFSRNLKIFRIAVVQYGTEARRDPTADNTYQLRKVAVKASEKVIDTLGMFIETSGNNMLGWIQSNDRVILQSQRLSILGVVLGAMAAVLVALMLNRSLATPIAKLVEGADSLAQGNLDFQVELDSSDDLGRVAESFNNMARELRLHINRQEELVNKARQAAVSEEKKANELEDANRHLKEEVFERHKAEKRITDALETTERILESMPFGVIIIGRDQKIRQINKAALKMMGLSSAEEILGRLCHQHICPAEKGACPLLDLGLDIDSSEKILLDREGQQIPILKTVVPMTLEGEEVLLEAFVEITAQKKTEKALEKARKAAESANLAKSAFLANMSHEIRTPMNGILGMTEILLGTELNPDQRRFAQSVYTSGESLLNVLNDILDFSKIEAGKLVLECVDFDLYTLVEDVADLFASSAHRKGLEIIVSIPEQVPAALQGDSSRLRQVLSNLIGNAVKFTEQGEVVVEISCETETNDHALLHFSVRDTGIGISMQNQARLFQPFSQADESTTRKFGGTGLGLAIAKNLVEIMGGHLTVKSETGKGSTFRFDCELKKSGIDIQAASSAPAGLAGRKILIVDDNATNRDILARQLSSWGLVPTDVSNAADALKVLKETCKNDPFSLVILDEQMPETNGLQLAFRIRENTQLANIPLILLSSSGITATSEEIKRAAIKACHSKPMRQSELRQSVAKLLSPLPESDKMVPAEENQPQDTGVPSGIRILVAEDNPVNQEVILNILNFYGCETDLAENGRMAMDAWQKNPYDLILMDCQMPEMDGYEVTEVIRREEQKTGTHIPVIALTAHALKGDREKCLAAGMDDFLSKPFKRQQLLDILKQWVGGEKTVKATTSANADNRQIEPIIDANALENIRSLESRDNPGILKKVIGIYLQEAPEIIQTLRRAIADEDAETVHQKAHYFKSSCANLGAFNLSDLCRKLEFMAKEGTLETASGVLDKIASDFPTLETCLLNEIKK